MSFPNSNHLEMLRAAQRSLNNALPIIEAAEACGIDCTEYRQGHAALSQQAESLIARLFPDQAANAMPQGVPRHDG